MRVLIISPDGMGDFVLREPLWGEMCAAGMQLTFLMRRSICEAARAIVPAAKVWEIPGDPYDLFPDAQSTALEELAARLQSYRPELLVIAPFVRTWFDDWVQTQLPSVPVVGFAGRRYPAGVNSLQTSPAPCLTRQCEAAIELSELEKNRLLAEAVLQRPIVARAPRLTPDPAAQQRVRARLAASGWTNRAFHVACVGDGPRNRQINWPAERWAELLQYARQRHDWRFILTGVAEERETNRRIVAASGISPDRVLLLDDPELSFAELVALLSLSAGYVGRDSGPMHLAAALDKPVLAVFAGGTWPRFVPAAKTGRIYTMAVPCAGCGNFCHLPACYCIKELPLAPVVAGLDAMADDLIVDLACEVLPRPVGLAERMEREAAEAGRPTASIA